MSSSDGMIFLAGKSGSKVVTVLCSKCGRISRQISRDEYTSGPSLALRSSHTCPICESVYSVLSEANRASWSSAFGQYEKVGEQAYNSAVKNAYQAKSNAVPKAAQSSGQYSALVQNDALSKNTAKNENETNSVMICSVEFSGSGRCYDYISTDLAIAVDDRVIVCVGNDESEKIATVKNIGFFAANKTPYPVDKMKQIIRKANTQVNMNDEPSSANTEIKNTAAPQASYATDDASFGLEQRTSYDAEPIHGSIPIPVVKTTSEHSHSKKAVFDRKFEHWKKQLLDLSKRNKMINYRETKRTTLKILEPEFAELFNRLAVNEEALTFQRPIDKDSDIRTFSMLTLLETLAYPIPVHVGDIKTEGTLLDRKLTLNNLRTKSKLARDEQGTNILYLSFGFVEWRENSSSSAGWLKSPVLMMPVSLKLESISAPFTLSRYDDEIEVNPTLDYLFNERYGVDLPTFELKDEDSIEQYMQSIEELADKNGWKLTREISLGLLSFLKISMYHDLNNSYDRMIRNPVVRAITGNVDTANSIPNEFVGFDFDCISPDACYQVVNADSSQQEAIMLSKAGVSFVMQGPPGTGKSQTITNIIAEALADGKKVLFVSEKAAALQVVHKRLTEVGLDSFCLALHSHKANKKEILDSIAANLKLSQTRIKESVMAELSELFHDKQFLNQYVRELHDEIMPLEKSLYEAFGELSSLNDIVPLPFALESPEAISAADYHKMLYGVSSYAKALGELGVCLSENPWSGTRIKQLDENLRNNIFSNILAIAPKLIDLHILLTNFQRNYYLEEKSSWSQVDRVSLLLDSFEHLPLFPEKWADKEARRILLLVARERNELLSSYQNGVETIKNTFTDSVFKINMDDLVSSLSNALDSIHTVVGYSTLSDTEILNSTQEKLVSLNSTISDFEKLIGAYKALGEKTGIIAPCMDSNIRSLSVICSMIIASPIINPDWCSKEGYEYAKSLLVEAQSRSTRLINVRTEVLNEYSDSVLSLDIATYHNRFVNTYTDEMRSVFSQYKNDVGVLGKYYSGNEKPEHDTIIVLLESLLKIKSLNDELSKNDSELQSHFTNEYKGIDTNWEMLNKLFEQLDEQIKKARPLSNEIISEHEAVNVKWETGVFDIDAGAMLLRFRTKYTSFLKFLKPSYRRDVLLLKGQYKVFGEKLTDAIAVALLQDLKNISDKHERLSQETSLVARHIPNGYNGYRTDWNSVTTIFGQIVNAKEKASTIVDEIIAIRKTILEVWSDEAFSLGTVEAEQMLSRFSTDYTPSFYEAMHKYIEDIELFVGLKMKDKDKVNVAEILDLLRRINTINDETQWFTADSTEKLISAFGEDYIGFESQWNHISSKIEYCGSLLKELRSDVVPEMVKAIICDKTALNREKPEIVQKHSIISSDNLDKILTGARSLILVADDPNINVLLAELYSLRDNFAVIKNAVDTLQGCAISKFPNDSVMLHAQEIQSSNSLKLKYLSFEVSDSAMFVERYRVFETDWENIISDLNELSEFFEFTEAGLRTSDFIRLVSDDTVKRAELSNAKVELNRFASGLNNGYTAFRSLFKDESNLHELSLDKLSERITSCANNFMMLENWITCEEAKAVCDELGLSDFTAKVEEADNTIEDVVGAFKRGFYTTWVQSVIGRKKAVEQFRRHVQDSRINHFVLLDDKQLYIARERIRQNVIENIPDANRTVNANDELSILQREIGKKRRIMPLRKLFKAIPNLLLKLKPCLMMSPLSVAYFLEAESYEFDTVIFDEASQIFPQDAIGAIFRGKQVIITGDSKQLPPTNFFAASTSNSDDYDTEYEDEFGKEIFDSILEETTGVLPNKRLLWHYRSKHENLIAFSNQGIYDNDLITFPSSIETARDMGIEFVFVEDGIYEGKGRNTGEARRCVELVKAHIDKHPNRSLGIIAFSESQQKAITQEIQKFREQNPEYEDFFTEDKEDEFFVKNLENVQGDERDTIIFSVSYTKTKEQRDNNREMALRFGPLGQKGGERRLNVAITRAKRNVKLVSSIVPSDINLSRTESEGVRMLRSYIEFAMHGSTALQTARNADENDMFMDIVSEFIVSQGYSIKKYVGCSGYKIDIAVMHPEADNCFIAGIECDGYSYNSAKTARDRDHLRKSILESMGWSIYRVWSPEWMARPEIERQRLIAFIEEAIAANSTKSAVVEDESTTSYKNTEVLTEIVREEATTNFKTGSIRDDNDNPYGFEAYFEADWTDAPRSESGKITDTGAIKYIVGSEQPIHIDVLYQRMARAYGNQKATVTIRNNVDRVLHHPNFREVTKKDEDGFVTLAEFRDLKVRVPSPGSQARQINYISIDEIGLAMTTIASQAIGIASDDLIDATAKALGYARKGERVMSCMNKAFDKLVKAGRVRIIDGKVNVVGGEIRG